MKLMTLLMVIILLSLFTGQLWAEGKYELLWTYPTSGAVYDVAISADGGYIGAGTWNNKVYFFSSSGYLLWSYETGGKVSVDINNDGSYIIAGSEDNNAYLFNRSGDLLWNYRTDGDVLDVAISGDGEYMAVGSNDYSVYFFNRSGNMMWSYNTGDKVESISMSNDGKYIAVGSGRKVYLFERSGKPLWRYMTGYSVKSVAISSDGKYIVACAKGVNVYLFDRSGKLLWSYQIEGDRGVNHVSISSNGSYIAVGGINGIYLFNRLGTMFFRYRTDAAIYSISISGNDNYIVACSNNNSFYLFNRSGVLLWSDRCRSDLAMSKEGKYIAVALGWKVGLFAEPEGRAIALKAEEAIKKAEETINDAKSNGYMTSVAEEMLKEAEQAFKARNYRKAIYLAEQAEANIETIVNDSRTLAFEAIENARKAINAAKSKNYVTITAEKLLSEAEQTYDIGNYKEAIITAEKAKVTAEEIIKNADEAKEIIKIVEDMMGPFEKLNLEEELLNKAKNAFKSGKYNEAKSYAEQAKVNIEEATMIYKTIETSKYVIDKAISKGYNTTIVEYLLNEAKDAFYTGDYNKAKIFADKAKFKAEEIIKEGDQASEALNISREAIIKAKSNPLGSLAVRLCGAEAILAQAEGAFAAGDYTETNNLATKVTHRVKLYLLLTYIGTVLGIVAIAFVTFKYHQRWRRAREEYEHAKAEVIRELEEVIAMLEERSRRA